VAVRLQSVETVSLIADSIGSSRGEVAMRLLLEMNHEVRGDFVEETVEQVCRVTHFTKFNFSPSGALAFSGSGSSFHVDAELEPKHGFFMLKC
jgi:hypothetical protein